MQVFNKSVLFGLIVVGSCAATVQAEDQVRNYVKDSGGTVVTDSSGDCARTADQTSIKLEECGYQLAQPEPEPEAEPEAPKADLVVEGVATETAATLTVKHLEKIVLAAAMLFDFDSAELSNDAKAVIDERIERIRGRAKLTSIMKVVGHTDSTGSAAYNLKLSQARAQAVADYIAANSYRVRADDMEVIGMGESEPVASNDTQEGRQLNRRVEILAEAEVELEN